MSNKIISDEHLRQITSVFEKTERKSGEYVTDQKHVMTKWIIRMLLGRDTSTTNPVPGQDGNRRVTMKSELEVQNLYSGLFHIISEKIADGAGNATLPEGLEKYGKFRDNTNDLVSCGFSGYEIVGSSEEGATKAIAYVPANEIVIADTVTRYVYLKGTYEKEERNFLFVKKYFDGKNTNELYVLDKGSRQNGSPVSFDVLNLKYEAEESTGLEGLSIFIGDIDPLYKVVEQLVFAFERNLVNIQVQFYKYLEAWLVMRGIKFDAKDKSPDGGIKPEAIRQKIVTTSDPEATIEYIALENPALDKLIEFNTSNMIRQISAITSIPTFYFGLEETTGAFGEEATRLRLQDFVTRCEKYREVHDEVFSRIIKALKKQGALSWTDVIRPSNKELLEEYGSAQKLGIITKKQMVMEYWNLDEKEADKFIAELKAEAAENQKAAMETAAAMATDKPNPNTPGDITPA